MADRRTLQNITNEVQEVIFFQGEKTFQEVADLFYGIFLFLREKEDLELAKAEAIKQFS